MSCKVNLKEAFNKSKEEPKYFDVDVVFLTLILQSVGFRLDNFEFAGKTDGITTNDLKVNIKCEKTGLTANMSFDTSNCTCPDQQENSAFWEVQGSAPNTPKKKDTIIEKSSSFIPEISKNCSTILKNCMTDLINYLDKEVNNLNKSTSDLSNVKQFVEKLNSDNLLSKIQDCARLTDYQQAIKNIKIEKTPEERSTTLLVTPFTTPLSSINITPINLPIAPKILINDSNKCSTPPAEGFDNSISPFNLIDKTSNLITSSPNSEYSQSRDANIIQAIIDAKQKLDNALIFLKFNMSQTIDSTSFTMTPKIEVLGQKNGQKVQSSISRRQSLGSIGSMGSASRTTLGSIKKAMPPPLSLPKRDAKHLTSRNLSLLSRSKPDTPRPGEINKTNRLGLVRKPVEKSVSTVRPSPLSKTALSKSYSKLPTKKGF